MSDVLILNVHPAFDNIIADVTKLWLEAFPSFTPVIRRAPAFPGLQACREMRKEALAAGATRLVIVSAHCLPMNYRRLAAALPPPGKATLFCASPWGLLCGSMSDESIQVPSTPPMAAMRYLAEESGLTLVTSPLRGCEAHTGAALAEQRTFSPSADFLVLHLTGTKPIAEMQEDIWLPIVLEELADILKNNP